MFQVLTVYNLRNNISQPICSMAREAAHNQLVGRIPDELGMLPMLERVYVSLRCMKEATRLYVIHLC